MLVSRLNTAKRAKPQGAALLLKGEVDGLAADFTTFSPNTPSHLRGTTPMGDVMVKDTATAANNVRVGGDEFWTQAGTSPKLVNGADGALRWSPHNLFLNSGVPATQNVTILIVGALYTVKVTGAGGGSITGSVGASGVATTGSPATFTATGTSGTFTLAGSLDTIQINRGPVATNYIATAGAVKYGLAIDYANGSYGLLIESQVTNIITRSQEFDNAAWTKSSVTVTADSIADPIGVVTADTLTATGANGFVSQGASSNFNVGRIFSVFLKRKTGVGAVSLEVGRTSAAASALDTTWRRFSVIDTVLAGTYAVVSNVITVTATGHGLIVGDNVRLDITSGTATDANVTVATSADANTFTAALVTADTTGNVNVYASQGRIKLATSGDEVYAWGGQLETLTGVIAASSHIPTFAASGSRAQDSISKILTAVPFSATAWSWWVHAASLGPVNGTLVTLSDGTANERNAFVNTNSTQHTISVTDGGVSQVSALISSFVLGTPYKFGFALAANDAAWVKDGGTPATDASVTLPTVTTLNFADNSGNLAEHYRILKFVLLPRRMTNAELQAVTSL